MAKDTVLASVDSLYCFHISPFELAWTRSSTISKTLLRTPERRIFSGVHPQTEFSLFTGDQPVAQTYAIMN